MESGDLVPSFKGFPNDQGAATAQSSTGRLLCSAVGPAHLDLQSLDLQVREAPSPQATH